MPEPKTIRDAWNRGIDPDSTTESTAYEFLRDCGDYHIIPGANAVVTPQGLEDAAKAAVKKVVIHFDDVGNIDRVDVPANAIARAALEAAGVVCVDEVVEEHGVARIYLGWTSAEHTETVTAERRDTLYIKRAVTVNHSKKE